MIDAYASRSHYVEHLAPVWAQLEEAGIAGTFYGLGGVPLRRRARAGFTLVAGFVDYQRVPGPIVFLEHGAGQSYDGDERSAGNPCYSGGDRLDRVRLFLAPNDATAQRWQARYDAAAVGIGCPKLDAWHDGRRHSGARDGGGVVGSVAAVTFHWQCALVPETQSAWSHYDRALPGLVEWARSHDVELLGHGHPRIWRQLERRWRTLGVEPVEQLEDVFARAALLVGDNTSALPEFASLGRPVLWLNAPWYRRDVDHGGRFWQWPRGQVMVNAPETLEWGVQYALQDPPSVQRSRAAMVSDIYAAVDGKAAARAATAIMEVVG